jgi:hypothetical protein
VPRPNALGIGWKKPVKAEVRVVGALLLGKEQREADVFGESRPSRVMVVGSSGLGAAVQNDDEWGVLGQIFGKIISRLQRAGIRTEASQR